MNLTFERQLYLQAEQAKWLTIDEAAHVLRTSKNKVLSMLRANTLPHRRDGKLIRIHLDDLRPNQEAHHVE